MAAWQHRGSLVSTVGSQQEGPSFKSRQGPFLRELWFLLQKKKQAYLFIAAFLGPGRS